MNRIRSIRHLAPLLALALLPACLIVIDANSDSELEQALDAWGHPGFRQLSDDLDDIGWDIEDIDRRGDHWRFVVEDENGREATLLVRLGPGREYSIESVRARDERIERLDELAYRSRDGDASETHEEADEDGDVE